MPNPDLPYHVLTCGICGEQVVAKYALKRMQDMLKHWNDEKHPNVPVFDEITWKTRWVRGL